MKRNMQGKNSATMGAYEVEYARESAVTAGGRGGHVKWNMQRKIL
jgi:hypothetical protein